MSAFTVGVDIGTTGTKTVLFDAGGGIVAQSTRASALYSDHPGWAEADPQQWLVNVVDSITEVVAAAKISPREVKAIATTGMVPAVIPIDAAGQPLRRAILQNDARATAQIRALAERLAAIDLVALTGAALTQQSVAPTVLWLDENEAETVRRTAYYVGSYDWILIALGARPHVEKNWALESGLFTIAGDPVEAVLDEAHIEPAVLPRVLGSGEVAGGLSEAMAQATGLHAGTPLIVGGADHVLSAFAAGVEQHGEWLVKLGGAGDILVATDEPVIDSRLYLDAHPIPGRWLPNGCMATSGSLIRWFQGLIGGEDLMALDREAQDRRPAEVLCLPYFLGEKSPLHDPDLRGVYAGLHLGTTRADMYRSTLEAIAFGFRHHVEVFADLGIDLGRVSVTNGGSKSTLWKQIHAEVLGVEMYPVVDHPGASLGAALIAAVGIGALTGWDECSRFATLGEPVLPDPRNVAVYDAAYREWRALSAATADISHSIAERTRQ
ncbi:FGGY-family carbohydrate kinase [Mycolicibacterium sphagni]|uniref:Carbohydrate kinase n=1 Tax=Mycolicibacterium sphagni TaxID=1786 RepID=A0A255DV22_9MYCO|nr:FGGY-family carbohydrate kinase [Mycolicibacterium sphagni]MCV7180035.1 FGGY-family carbohydrate kinase [Mycolicibacterium sphagni]OYN80842.1 carbohydrate kinase [Mycolicibacterium sphagni]